MSFSRLDLDKGSTFQPPYAGSFDEFKRRNDQHSVQLRQAKRFDHVARQRAKDDIDQQSQSSLKQLYPQLFSSDAMLSTRMDLLMQLLISEREEVIWGLLQYVRSQLVENGFVRELTAIPFTGVLKSFLATEVCSNIQIEALKLLKQLTGLDEFTVLFASHLDMPAWVAVLLASSRSDYVQLACLEAAACIACHNREWRDKLVETEILKILLSLATNAKELSFLSLVHVGKVLCNIAYYVSQYDTSDSEIICQTIRYLIDCVPVTNVTVLQLWMMATTYVLREEPQTVINLGLHHKVISLLDQPETDLVVWWLRALSNLSAGDNMQCNILFRPNLLDALSNFIRSSTHTIRQESLHILSNLILWDQRMVALVLDHAQLFNKMVVSIADCDFAVRREATFLLYNSVKTEDAYVVSRLLHRGILEHISYILSDTDPTILQNALSFINYLFEKNEEIESLNNGELLDLAELFYENDYVKFIEEKQNHPNELVHQMASYIVKSYFDGENSSSIPTTVQCQMARRQVYIAPLVLNPLQLSPRSIIDQVPSPLSPDKSSARLSNFPNYRRHQMRILSNFGYEASPSSPTIKDFTPTNQILLSGKRHSMSITDLWGTSRTESILRNTGYSDAARELKRQQQLVNAQNKVHSQHPDKPYKMDQNTQQRLAIGRTQLSTRRLKERILTQPSTLRLTPLRSPSSPQRVRIMRRLNKIITSCNELQADKQANLLAGALWKLHRKVSKSKTIKR